MFMDGPPRMVAWQPGQVGNEAAIPNNYQCRGFGSSFFQPLSAPLFLPFGGHFWGWQAALGAYLGPHLNDGR